jgi:hypothetical protein
MINIATGEQDPLTAQLLVDVLDLVSAGVLRSAGLADDEVRAILASLWTDWAPSTRAPVEAAGLSTVRPSRGRGPRTTMARWSGGNA